MTKAPIRVSTRSKPGRNPPSRAELAEDLPKLAKIALDAMIRDHNPDYKGTANKVGAQACSRACVRTDRYRQGEAGRQRLRGSSI